MAKIRFTHPGDDPSVYDPFELAKSVYHGTFDLLCPHMKLVLCPAYHQTILEGCGVISADDEGRLSFRFSFDLPRPIPEVLYDSRPEGEIYDAHEHVMLIARDVKGREWRSNWLLVHLNNPGEHVYSYISRPLEHLSQSRPRTNATTHTMQMFIPQIRSLPLDGWTEETRTAEGKTIGMRQSCDYHVRDFDGTKVRFRKEDDNWLRISMSQTDIVMPQWPGLLCHALEFAAVQDIRPVVICRSTTDWDFLQVSGGPFLHFASRLPRPNNGIAPNDAESFWLLVEKLFFYYRDKEETIEPVLDELSGIRSGAQGSMQTACLTLAVGLESLAGQLLSNEPTSTPDSEKIKCLMDHVRSWGCDDKLQERALGTLRQLKSVRAQDRLYAWADRTGVPKQLVDEWKAMRNRKAHGKQLSEGQSSLDQYYAVVDLLYRLVASAVSYDGPLTPVLKSGRGE